MSSPGSQAGVRPSGPGASADTVLMARVFTALRIFTGLVWLSNGVAKLIGKEQRIGVGPAPDQQFGADRDGFCIK